MYYIYKITNLINGKTYIGQHKYKDLNDDYMGSGVHLRRAQKKYGIENFKKEILVFNVAKKEHADLLEKTFIVSEREKVGPENCYNVTDGGEGFFGHHSEETKRKIAETTKGHPHPHKGSPHSEETKRKIAEAKKGKPHSEEHKRKIAETMKGKKVSEETKMRMSEAHKGKPTWNKGKKMSEDFCKKVSEIMKGRHWKLVDGKRVWY